LGIEKVEISVTTQSGVMYWNQLPQPSPPTITMNGKAIPKPSGPPTPVGWQLVVIDATKDITNPSSFLYNQYLCLITKDSFWSGVYHQMYDYMFRNIYLSGNVNQQLVLLSSFGLDQNMPPTNDMLPELMELGAGPRLQYWETHCIPGSQVGSTNAYVSFPANYILIGYSSWSYGQGYEKYETKPGQPGIQSTLTATVNNIVPG
jgi:hypothetical protein